MKFFFLKSIKKQNDSFIKYLLVYYHNLFYQNIFHIKSENHKKILSFPKQKLLNLPLYKL